jgi:hypothetical protein
MMDGGRISESFNNIVMALHQNTWSHSPSRLIFPSSGGAISPYVGVAGLGLGGVLAYSGQIQNPIFYLVLLAGGYETFMRFYDPTRLPPNYFRIPLWRRVSMTVSYVGLIAALLAAMSANQQYRKPPEVLMRERELEKHWDMR